jgi:hypothetical protein
MNASKSSDQELQGLMLPKAASMFSTPTLEVKPGAETTRA